MDAKDSYNRSGLIALVGSVVFSLGFFIYVTFVMKGVDLQEVKNVETGAVEQKLAGGPAESAAVAFDPAKISKPWEESPEMIAHGKAIYANNCAVCHGTEGKGDGPAGGGLVPPPRNLVEGKWKKGGDRIALYDTLEKGLAGSSMASFAHLPKIDRWSLVHFIRSITKDKIADDSAKVEKFAQTAK